MGGGGGGGSHDILQAPKGKLPKFEDKADHAAYGHGKNDHPKLARSNPRS